MPMRYERKHIGKNKFLNTYINLAHTCKQFFQVIKTKTSAGFKALPTFRAAHSPDLEIRATTLPPQTLSASPGSFRPACSGNKFRSANQKHRAGFRSALFPDLFFSTLIPKLVWLNKKNGINKIEQAVTGQYVFIVQIFND